MATSTIPNLNLSFDTTPTSGSSKPVTSNGIYNAIQQSTADKIDGVEFLITTATTFTIPNNARFMMFVTDSGSSRCGIYAVVSTGAGAVSSAAIGDGAGQTTVTAGTNTLTITPTSGGRNILFIDITMSGKAPTIPT